MPHISIARAVNLTADQAFAIAADVSSYKDFLPLLERSTIRGERIKTGLIESFAADLTVGYFKLGVRESFTSHVVCDRKQATVTATSSDGPIKSLTAIWKISANSSGKTEVAISVDYVLRNMVLQLLARGLMDMAVQKIMQAFEERGRNLYGSV